MKSNRIAFTWTPISTISNSRKRFWVAICHFSKRVARVTNPKNRGILEILVINDTLITNGICEEGERCLDNTCPMNHTTSESFARAFKIPIKSLPIGFPASSPFRELQLDEFVKAHPNGGIVIAAKKRLAKVSSY